MNEQQSDNKKKLWQVYADFFIRFFIPHRVGPYKACFCYRRLCKTSIRLNSSYTSTFYHFYSLGLLQNIVQYDFLIVYRFIQFFFFNCSGCAYSYWTVLIDTKSIIITTVWSKVSCTKWAEIIAHTIDTLAGCLHVESKIFTLQRIKF